VSDKKIGIKIADGTFYPILDEEDSHKKKMVLTTVKDNQENVQIDLYRGEGDQLVNPAYIGSLIVENIEESSAGGPEIELVFGIDSDGNLSATASDNVTSEKQSLSVSLQSIEEEGLYEIPEFELDEGYFPEVERETEQEEESGDIGQYPEPQEAEGAEEGYEEESDGMDNFEIPDEPESFESGRTVIEEKQTQDQPEKKEKRLNPVLLVVFLLLSLLGIAAITFLFIRLFTGSPVPPLSAENQNNAVEEPAEPSSESDAETDKAAEKESADSEAEPSGGESAEVAESGGTEKAESGDTAQSEGNGMQAQPEDSAEKQVRQQKTENGVWYMIKYGDTLWDISQSYYRTPWLYEKIAEANDIEDPDLIYANTKLYIPPK